MKKLCFLLIFLFIFLPAQAEVGTSNNGVHVTQSLDLSNYDFTKLDGYNETVDYSFDNTLEIQEDMFFNFQIYHNDSYDFSPGDAVIDLNTNYVANNNNSFSFEGIIIPNLCSVSSVVLNYE